MLNLTVPTRIHVYASAADMRKGIDGLSGIVRQQLASDPTDGSLFVFINRRRDRMKILHFDGGGFWLYYRVLQAGTFEELSTAGDSRHITMDATELAMLLSGVSLVTSQRRRKRYVHRKPQQAA